VLSRLPDRDATVRASLPPSGGGQQACVDVLTVAPITGLGGRVEGGGVRMRRNAQKNKRTLCYLEASVLSRRAHEGEAVCGAGTGDGVFSGPQWHVRRCIHLILIGLHLDVHSTWQREITSENIRTSSE